METRREAPQDWPALLEHDFVESDVLVPDLAKPNARVLSPGGAQRLGPVGLKEKVIELGGTLAIRSAEDGATLDIRLPLSMAAS